MKKNYIKGFISRVLVCIILFLIISIICNFSDKNLLWFKNNIYNNNIDFRFFNNIYNKYIDKYIPFKVKEDNMVMNNKILFKNKTNYLNGVSLEVGKGSSINSLCGGIVVYIGNKEKLGKTIIIQGIDGVDYWYSNIDNLNISLYDYVEKNYLLGESINDYIYLTFMKNGKYLDYEEFI